MGNSIRSFVAHHATSSRSRKEMKLHLIVFLLPLCIFGSEIKKDYDAMLKSFEEYKKLPLKEPKEGILS